MPTAETLFLLVLSLPAMESADSIRSLYRHFLSSITEKSLNAFHYACSYAKVDYSRFVNVTASKALKLIPDLLELRPVFLFIDDTMVSKQEGISGCAAWIPYVAEKGNQAGTCNLHSPLGHAGIPGKETYSHSL